MIFLQEVVLKNGPYTRLIPDLNGVNPDDAFSIVPYEKGFTLLFYLETLLGGAGKSSPLVCMRRASLFFCTWRHC
jgi:leukotriene-A4 hydrolase